jgi:hypothetical protein
MPGSYEDPGCLCKCCCAPCSVYMAKECAVSQWYMRSNWYSLLLFPLTRLSSLLHNRSAPISYLLVFLAGVTRWHAGIQHPGMRAAPLSLRKSAAKHSGQRFCWVDLGDEKWRRGDFLFENLISLHELENAVCYIIKVTTWWHPRTTHFECNRFNSRLFRLQLSLTSDHRNNLLVLCWEGLDHYWVITLVCTQNSIYAINLTAQFQPKDIHRAGGRLEFLSF